MSLKKIKRMVSAQNEGELLLVQISEALNWNLNFAAPYEAELSVSFYPNAQRWPFQDIDKPGLDFSGNGRGCNTLTGEFTISKMIYDFFGVPRRFSATLEQHCEDAPPGALWQYRL